MAEEVIPPPPDSGLPTVPPPDATAGPLATPGVPDVSSPINLLNVLGAVQPAIAKAAAIPFRLAGKLDVAAGNKTPEQAEATAKKYGEITRDVAESAAVPWSQAAGVPGFLARMGQAGVLSAAQNPSAPMQAGGLGALTTGALDAASMGVRKLLSFIPKNLFASKTGAELADWLKSNVPAWTGFSTDAKGLTEMAHGTGLRTLREGIDAAFENARDAIPTDKTVVLPLKVANKIGVRFEPPLPQAEPVVGGDTTVKVFARDLADRLYAPTDRPTGDLRAKAIDALDKSLPEGFMSDARRAYRIGQGWIDFATKGGFLKGERYDPVKAMQAAQSVGQQTLLNRGMDPVRSIVRGPLQNPMTQYTPPGLPYHLGAAGLGAGLGLATHSPYGFLAAFMPRPTFYGNVPVQFPFFQGARQILQEPAAQQLIRPMMGEP